jgi:hypothetical protein
LVEVTEILTTDSCSNLVLTSGKHEINNLTIVKNGKNNVAKENPKLNGMRKNIINMTMKVSIRIKNPRSLIKSVPVV